MNAVDTNVLVYAHRGESKLHEPTFEFISHLCNGDEAWGLPSPCLSEFLRVVTHPRVFSPPSTIEDAMKFVEACTSAPSFRTMAPGRLHQDFLFRAIRDARASGNLVFDAQIAAICLEHNVSSLYSFDRDFRRFQGITLESPV